MMKKTTFANPLAQASSREGGINPLFELAKSQLPRVGGAFGHSASIGFSYLYALEIAVDTISELPENEAAELLKEICESFEKWKFQHGVYPPKRGIFASSGQNDIKQESAKKYIERQALAFALLGKEPDFIDPWECDDFADTPIKLFLKLFSDNYEPLNAVIYKHGYEYTLATVIMMTHNPKSEFQSEDCIEGALRLAQARLSSKKRLIKSMGPLAQEAWNRKRRAQIRQKTQKEEKERKILVPRFISVDVFRNR